MNTPKYKTAVKVTMRLTWANRMQFFKAAFRRGPSITFVDNDVKEVLIKEEKNEANCNT